MEWEAACGDTENCVLLGCACLSIGIYDSDGGLNSLNLFCETVFISIVIGVELCICMLGSRMCRLGQLLFQERVQTIWYQCSTKVDRCNLPTVTSSIPTQYLYCTYGNGAEDSESFNTKKELQWFERSEVEKRAVFSMC